MRFVSNAAAVAADGMSAETRPCKKAHEEDRRHYSSALEFYAFSGQTVAYHCRKASFATRLGAMQEG
jgi:hypothetical protein